MICNLLLGTAEERGLVDWGNNNNNNAVDVRVNKEDDEINSYDFPCGMAFVKRFTWLRWVWHTLYETECRSYEVNHKTYSSERVTRFVISAMK